MPYREFTNIVGIDPGVNGGVARLSMKGLVEFRNEFPLSEVEVKNHRKPRKGATKKDTRIERSYNLNKLHEMLDQTCDKRTVVYLEKVWGQKDDSPSSAFKFGRCFGELRAVLACLKIPFIEVAPTTWQNRMHKGCTGKNAKAKSLMSYEINFENESLGYKKPHDGIMDATLIAEYGRQRILNECDYALIQE